MCTRKFVTRNTFSSVFATAWSRAMTITASFRVTGVYPFDRKAAAATVQSSLTKESFLGRKVSLAFVPLITPTPSRQPKHHEVTSRRQMRKERCNKSFEDSNALLEAGNFSRHEATSLSIGEERLLENGMRMDIISHTIRSTTNG